MYVDDADDDDDDESTREFPGISEAKQILII